MAVSIGAHTLAQGNGVTAVTTTGQTTQNGSTFLVYTPFGDWADITDSKGNFYEVKRIQTNGGTAVGYLYECRNGIGGAGHTVTVTFAGTGKYSVHFVEVIGGDSVDVVVGDYDPTGVTTYDVDVPTLESASSLALMFGGNDALGVTATITVSSGFTVLDKYEAGLYYDSVVAYATPASTAGFTAGWSPGGTSTAAGHAIVVTYYPGSGSGSRRQEHLAVSGAGTVSRSIRLTAAPVSGNLLVAALVVDKNAGTITVPSGWTRIGTDYVGPSVSMSLAYKIAVGTETLPQFTWTTTQAGGSAMWIAEYNGVALSATAQANSADITTQSQTSGTATAVAGATRALAIFGVDTDLNNWSGESQAVRTYSNSFIEQRATNAFIAGWPGVFVARKTISGAGSVETTITTTLPGDQVAGAMLTFVPANTVFDDVVFDSAVFDTGTGAAAALTASMAASASTSASLSTAIPLASAVAAVASTAASLSTAIPLGSAMAAVASATAAIATSILLASSPVAQASASGSLTTAIPLTATVAASTAVTASLTTGIKLASSPVAQASVTADLTTAAAPWQAGFNFRATQGYITDNGAQTYVLGDAYPTTRIIGGVSVTFGWESQGSDALRDRSNSATYAPEFCGVEQLSGASPSEAVFRIDLPSAGSYEIKLGAADAAFTNKAFFGLRDGTTEFQSVAETTIPQGQVADATGALFGTIAAWRAGNTSVSRTFSTTIFRLALKLPSANASIVSHITIARPAIRPWTTAYGAASVTAALTTQIPLAASSAAVSTLTSSVTTAIPLASAVAGQSSVTANLTAGSAALAASPLAQASVTASLTTSIKLASAPAAAAAVTASLTTAIPLASAPACQSAVTAALTTAIPLATSLTGQSAVTANLLAGSGLSMSSASQAAVTATLTTAIPLASTQAASSTVTAALLVPKPLAASALGQSAVTASLTTAIPLATSLSSQSAVTASLLAATNLSAPLTAQSAVTASLTTAIPLAAPLAASATFSATLVSPPIQLTASPAAQSAVTASLTTAIPLASASAAQSAVTASLTTGIRLGAGFVSQSSLTASMGSVPAALTAAPAAASTLAATLTTQIPLASSVSAAATLTATATTGIQLSAAWQATTDLSANFLYAQAQWLAAVQASSASFAPTISYVYASVELVEPEAVVSTQLPAKVTVAPSQARVAATYNSISVGVADPTINVIAELLQVTV